MHDLVSRFVCGFVALGLIFLAAQAMRTGSVYDRGHAFTRARDPITFGATVMAQIGFAMFLAINAAGFYPLRVLNGLLAG